MSAFIMDILAENDMWRNRMLALVSLLVIVWLLMDKFTVHDGDRPDTIEAILENLGELSSAFKAPKEVLSKRADEILKNLSNEAIADKYFKFVLYMLATERSPKAQATWIPAFHILLDAMPSEEVAMSKVEKIIASNPDAYGSDGLNRALRMWDNKKHNPAKPAE